MRRPSISYELLASFAALRAKRRQELLLAQGATTMQLDPRNPNSVPEPMKDDVGKGNPIPSDFNDDDAEDEEFGDDADDGMDDDE